MKKHSRGFTILEVLFSIAILMIISLIVIRPFSNELGEKQLQAISDNIVSKLELAKSNSITGKNGQSYGVKFGDTYFTFFAGSSFISTNENNQREDIDDRFEIVNDIPGSDDTIIFSRMKGTINHNEEITITIREISKIENSIQLKIGKLGDISVIE